MMNLRRPELLGDNTSACPSQVSEQAWTVGSAGLIHITGGSDHLVQLPKRPPPRHPDASLRDASGALDTKCNTSSARAQSEEPPANSKAVVPACWTVTRASVATPQRHHHSSPFDQNQASPSEIRISPTSRPSTRVMLSRLPTRERMTLLKGNTPHVMAANC